MPFKSNSLSDKDIKDILKSQKIKIKGVFMKDELPSKLKTGFYVINLQSSFAGNGTHWTTFYYSPKHSYYFDAFGMIPPEKIHYMIHPYTYNDKQIQTLVDATDETQGMNEKIKNWDLIYLSMNFQEIQRIMINYYTIFYIINYCSSLSLRKFKKPCL